MRGDRTRETDAIGLDVAALGGMTRGEIRRRLPAPDVALVISNESVPAGWPEEILAVDREKDVVDFRFQDARGEWRTFARFRLSSLSRMGMAFAFVYTREPKSSPLVRVRPIVSVHFFPDGTCGHPSAGVAESQLDGALRRDLPAHQSPQPLLGPTPPGAGMQRVERLLALGAPLRMVDVSGFWAPGPESGFAQMIVGIESRNVVIRDVEWRERLRFVSIPGSSWRFQAIDAAGIWLPIEVEPGGLRARCLGATGEPIGCVDFLPNAANLAVRSADWSWQRVSAVCLVDALDDAPGELVLIPGVPIECGPLDFPAASATVDFDATLHAAIVRDGEKRVLAKFPASESFGQIRARFADLAGD